MITTDKIIGGLLLHAYKAGIDPFTSVDLVRGLGFKDEDIHNSVDIIQSLIVKHKWNDFDQVPTLLEWMNNTYE